MGAGEANLRPKTIGILSNFSYTAREKFLVSVAESGIILKSLDRSLGHSI